MKAFFHDNRLLGCQIDGDTFRLDTRKLDERMAERYDRQINSWLTEIGVIRAKVESADFFNLAEKYLDKQ